MVHSSSLSGTANNHHGQGNNQEISPTIPDWPAVCQQLLYRALPCTSVQTQPEFVVKKPGRIPRSLKVIASEATSEHNAQTSYGPLEFLDSLLAPIAEGGEKSRYLAIMGEAGSGKTIFLQHFAQGLWQRYQEGRAHCLPIWLNPSRFKHRSIKDYLFGPWLQEAMTLNGEIPPTTWRESLQLGLQAGQFWLVLDGVDYTFTDPGQMSAAQGSLTWLKDSLAEVPATPVLLSCRPDTRRNDPRGLAGFTRYQLEPLLYPGEVEIAIEDYFTPDRPAQSENQGQPNALATALKEALANPLVSHLRPYLLRPRRLMLCCRFWRDQPRDFPVSSGALYRQLTKAFYLWQSEWASSKPGQQEELAQLLGQLAKQMLGENPVDHRPLSPAEVEKIFGKDSPLLRSALQLGWLMPKTAVRKGVWERGYGFADDTFRDYFAAQAIADWHFFLDIYRHQYRIFAPEWQGVLTFWWGREDIGLVNKQAFLQVMLEFDDRCSPENFYGLRALESAALALRECPDLTQADEIVARLLAQGLTPVGGNGSQQKWAMEILATTHRPPVIQALLKTLQTTEDDRVYGQCCQWLGQWGQGFPQVIGILEQQLALHQQSSLRFAIASALILIDPASSPGVATFLAALHPDQKDYSLAFQTLAHCGVGNLLVIKALLDLLSPKLSVLHHRQVLQCLEAVGKNQNLVIASVLQKLRLYPPGAFLCQMAESLERIDPGNPTALVVLQRHIQADQPLPLRKQAIYSLGEVGVPSPAVVASLADLLMAEEDVFVRWLIVSSLAKIAQGDPTAIATLTTLVEKAVAQPRSEEGDWLLNETIQALLKVDPHNVGILPSLVYLLENTATSEHLQIWAEILGRLDPGNPIAINTLLRLLRNKEDPYSQRQAATSLATIDPGNLSALMALINLLQNSDNESIRLTAAQDLALVGKNNPAVLAALIRVVGTNAEGEILRAVVKTLAQIGPNNREVAQALLGLLLEKPEDRVRQDAAQALIKIVPRKLLPTVVHQLQELCAQAQGENSGDHWQIFWYCAQQMTYADFYQAWHQTPLAVSGTSIPGKSSKQRSFFRYSLAQTLQGENAPLNGCQVIWIDTSQFLSLDNPSVDIYDQMLDQNCPEFDGAIPDNLSKLRFYWHQLQRKQGHPLLLLFEQLSPSPLGLEQLWQQLATFHGPIAILGVTPAPKTVVLPYFQLRESQTTAGEIVAWLQNCLTST
ncbi:HEAT repeat domain-containing protein [Synechocystis sp. FACHB-383]|uniref:NACHT C-terminal alpha/beta 1 domain-containing protein n=2 Tax=unclassified Synechocystis TaxID=2640012 RepID=UPI001F549ED3|nr:HEAT repeat domain-containing protein [Synechocystis sp. FACHB-383]